MSTYILDYCGHRLEVDIYPVAGPANHRSFDLNVRAPVDTPDAVLEGVLHYLHKEGFFDPDPTACLSSTCLR
jgi:hypothetical protein